MSAIKPDFYIGVIKNPPSIVSIGKTIDGMEVIDVVLNSELNEDKKQEFENAINKIGPAKPPKPNPEPAADTAAVEDTPPAVEDTPPAIEEAPPAVEDTPPAADTVAIEEAPPAADTVAVEDTPPAVEDTPPAVEDTPPAIEEAQPAVEEAAPKQIETQAAPEPDTSVVESTDTATPMTVFDINGSGKKTKRNKNKRRRTKRRKTKRSKK